MLVERLWQTHRKSILFALYGAGGCLVAWFFGEGLLLAGMPPQNTGGGGDTSLLFNPELDSRLAREGAKSGDVQFSLMWNNQNDLDLHCIDPNGEEIYYRHKRSRSRGELDVDMNAGRPFSSKPVENIYWPQEGSPAGTYRVYVNHYARHGANDPTAYTCGVAVRGQTREFTGSISHGESKRLIHEFTLATGVETPPLQFGRAAVVTALWTGLLGVGLSLALVAGQNRYCRRQSLNVREATLCIGGGLLAGLVAGGLGQMFFSLVQIIPPLAFLGRIAGWAILGGVLGLGMAFFVPNLSKFRALLAGAVGGGAGAVGFLIMSALLGDLVGRFLGAAVLGLFIGLMVALVEQLARSAWLVVHRDVPSIVKTADGLRAPATPM